MQDKLLGSVIEGLPFALRDAEAITQDNMRQMPPASAWSWGDPQRIARYVNNCETTAATPWCSRNTGTITDSGDSYETGH